MQDMFKDNVSMQDTHTQIMSSCKTLQFRKTCLLSLVGRHDLLKDMSSCLKMHFYCFYFLCFILLKTCLFPRHVFNMAPRHDFYSVHIRPYAIYRGLLYKSARLLFTVDRLTHLSVCYICSCRYTFTHNLDSPRPGASFHFNLWGVRGPPGGGPGGRAPWWGSGGEAP